MAGAVPVVSGAGERVIEAGVTTPLDRLQRAGALDRGAVNQEQVALEAWAVTGEVPDQRFDLLGASEPALMESVPGRQHGEQVPEALVGGPDEPIITGDAHDRLRDTQVTISVSLTRRRALAGRSGGLWSSGKV